MSFLWPCTWPAPGLDSISSPSGRQASPNIRLLGKPSRSVPMWQPAVPGSTPSVSFQNVVSPGTQSSGLISSFPTAPAILFAPAEGSRSECCEQADSTEHSNNRGSSRVMLSPFGAFILSGHHRWTMTSIQTRYKRLLWVDGRLSVV